MTGRKEKDVVERCSHGDMIECGHAMWSGDEVEPYNRARRSSDAVEHPQIALGYSLERLMFVVHLCYFNEGCEVVASNVLHNTVRVSLYVYFDLFLFAYLTHRPIF